MPSSQERTAATSTPTGQKVIHKMLQTVHWMEHDGAEIGTCPNIYNETHFRILPKTPLLEKTYGCDLYLSTSRLV